MLSRRRAICALAASLAAPRALAQSTGRVTRVGLLDAGERMEWWDAFRKQMHELGYVEGRNVAYEARFAKGKLEALPGLAKELVAKDVAIIVTGGAAAAVEAKRASSKIPIVMASGTDYVSLGLASSMARPGGNITGLASINSELMGKRLELLREFAPGRTRLGALWHADNMPSMASVRDLEGAAGRLNLAFQSFGVRSEEDLAEAFAAMARDRVDALVVVNGPRIYAVRRKIAELAQRQRIPAMYGAAEYVDAGGLVGYAPSYPDMYRGAAIYVDRILKGANPAVMPIAQPTKFELVINAHAARAIGLTIPQAMLARATRVIQ
jgi:putative ABC transport system substrate-binding protein